MKHAVTGKEMSKEQSYSLLFGDGEYEETEEEVKPEEIIVTCQHTGVEFKASSKRQKNHPLVSEFKVWATKNDGYKFAMDYLNEINGYVADIESAIELGELIVTTMSRKAHSDKVTEEKARKQQAQAREETNRILNNNGFRWVKVEVKGEHDIAFSDYSHTEWHLIDENGKSYTVAQAMAIIENKKATKPAKTGKTSEEILAELKARKEAKRAIK